VPKEVAEEKMYWFSLTLNWGLLWFVARPWRSLLQWPSSSDVPNRRQRPHFFS
jgi:hypothetical protein